MYLGNTLQAHVHSIRIFACRHVDVTMVSWNHGTKDQGATDLKPKTRTRTKSPTHPGPRTHHHHSPSTSTSSTHARCRVQQSSLPPRGLALKHCRVSMAHGGVYFSSFDPCGTAWKACCCLTALLLLEARQRGLAPLHAISKDAKVCTCTPILGLERYGKKRSLVPGHCSLVPGPWSLAPCPMVPLVPWYHGTRYHGTRYHGTALPCVWRLPPSAFYTEHGTRTTFCILHTAYDKYSSPIKSYLNSSHQ